MTDDHGTPEKVPEGKAPARWPGLQGSEQDEVVGQVDPQLVFVCLSSIGAQAGMSQGQAQILEEAALYLVIQAQIAFPFLVAGPGTIFPGSNVEVTAPQILGGKAQAGYIVGKVVVVLANPSLLTSALELVDLRVGDQVSGSAVAIVQEGKVAVVTHFLITQAQCMVAAVVGEHRAHGTVIHFAVVEDASRAIAALTAAVGTSRVAVEIAQIGNQLAFTQRQGMYRTQIVLFVIVLERGEVVAGDQVVAQLGITAEVLELVDPFSATGDAQTIVMAPVAAAGFVKLTGTQGDVINLIGGQRGTTVGLRQQATIVAFGNRQVGFQTATNDQLGIGHLDLTGKVDLAEFVDGAVIAFQRELVAGSTAGIGITALATRVQADTGAGKHIHTKADRALGVA